MRDPDAPDPDCPDCEEHPPLVYEGSVGPAGFGDRVTRENGVMFHYFKCAICGRRYRVTDADREPIPRREEEGPPEKPCHNCGEPMRVRRIAKAQVSSGPRKLGGNYNRVETELGWRCAKCGAADKLEHIDILGFN